MIGRQLTIEQRNAIQGVFFNDTTFFSCLKDVADNYFIMLSDSDIEEIQGTEWSYLIGLPESECILKTQIINNAVVVNVVDVNYLNVTASCTLDGVSFSIPFFEDFNEAKTILENETNTTITTISGNFEGQSLLNINNSIQFDCATITDLSVYEELSEIFACVKYKLMNV